MKVALVMGSVNDYKKVEDAVNLLKAFEVEVEVRAFSAHRAHHALKEFIDETKNDGTEVIIAAAGKAAHLPGVIASLTSAPVIGIPIKGSALDGMDALLSIVQMPPGIPVATVAIDGGLNAAILAIQIMANKHQTLKTKLDNYRQEMTLKVLEANDKLMKEIRG